MSRPNPLTTWITAQARGLHQAKKAALRPLDPETHQVTANMTADPNPMTTLPPRPHRRGTVQEEVGTMSHVRSGNVKSIRSAHCGAGLCCPWHSHMCSSVHWDGRENMSTSASRAQHFPQPFPHPGCLGCRAGRWLQPPCPHPPSFPIHFLLLQTKQNCSVNIKGFLSLVILPYTNFIKPLSFTVAREKFHDQEYRALF